MNVIDLFAGCGGLSLGFEMAGFKIPLAIEIDEWASETYKKNHEGTKVITEDITQITNLDELLDRNKVEIDGIIGGPPCQGFSLSGNRDPKDPRNSLFMEFRYSARSGESRPASGSAIMTPSAPAALSSSV